MRIKSKIVMDQMNAEKPDDVLSDLEAKHGSSAPSGSDASIKPQMSDEELANKLLCVLSQEMIRKADLFDYLCWLEEKQQSERVPGAAFLVLASDGRTCWGKTWAATVAAAMKYDAKPYGEHQNAKLTDAGPVTPGLA